MFLFGLDLAFAGRPSNLLQQAMVVGSVVPLPHSGGCCFAPDEARTINRPQTVTLATGGSLQPSSARRANNVSMAPLPNLATGWAMVVSGGWAN